MKKNFRVFLITEWKQLKRYFDEGETIYATRAGGYGEDDGAVVIGVGKVKDMIDKIRFDPDEMGCDTEEDIIEIYGDRDCVVIDKMWGQSMENFMIPEFQGTELAEEGFMMFFDK